MLAGGKAEDFYEYEGSEEEEFTDEAWAGVEESLSVNPFVHHTGEPLDSA